MNDREAFEAWISGPPYECEVTRFPEGSAWPGNYRAVSVDLAWFAWQAATAATQGRCAQAVEELDRKKWFPSQRDFAEACVDAIRKGE